MEGRRVAASPESLPRARQGSEPQRLLTTLLGDYWFWRPEHIPSSALVRLLGEFGITVTGARAALRRVASRGLLVSSREGRTTAYGLPPRAADVIVTHMRRLLTFGAATPCWDKQWTVVTFSVPEDQRDIRRALRDGLRLLHFGMLFDAVWVSPHDRTDDVVALARRLGVGGAVVFRAHKVAGDDLGPVLDRAFDIAALRGRYLRFIGAHRPVAERLAVSSPCPAEALRLRTAIMTDWRAFPTLDPDLPAELLPAGWPRDEARRLCVQIYDSLGEPAERRFREILSEFDPELAGLVAHHTFAQVSALESPATRRYTSFDETTDRDRLDLLSGSGPGPAP
ncbi:PaaX family transcriptional regulator C-terminal domain-containing protein [Microbispora bryophytorum]|uniref:PaaX family transcriptional regulator n=1 Tax=Microbispora bryophytorum subsp. camponoti TaxID=1677852 RepID=A0ABR8LBB3_9ACTN|nr:PaaX family transcriptional regulator C-terminal domain-containing protein [Microbispora camponoti]MBD3148169.1 PaaX family transcriptional regulator [Microbispora camponoti]